jgi:hypothetical protein
MTYRIEITSPIDYLLIGHLTQDITPAGLRLGGTAAYSSLTARALGMKVGVVTSAAPDIVLKPLDGVLVHNVPSEHSTTFENIPTPSGRVQYLYHTALCLTASMIPEDWKNPPIVHLGPVAQEVATDVIHCFPNSFIGLTPQGWMRKWDGDGRVTPAPWSNAPELLEKASAVILSIEDVQGNEDAIADLIEKVTILVVTEADLGARLYWKGDYRHFSPPAYTEIDATGAGDIFATAFFTRMVECNDPWESARYATLIASHSITRIGLDSIPTAEEISSSRITIHTNI